MRPLHKASCEAYRHSQHPNAISVRKLTLETGVQPKMNPSTLSSYPFIVKTQEFAFESAARQVLFDMGEIVPHEAKKGKGPLLHSGWNRRMF